MVLGRVDIAGGGILSVLFLVFFSLNQFLLSEVQMLEKYTRGAGKNVFLLVRSLEILLSAEV